jgi:hypothetical protein
MLRGYLLNDYLARKTELLQERWAFEVDYTSFSPKVSKEEERLRKAIALWRLPVSLFSGSRPIALAVFANKTAQYDWASTQFWSK